MKLSAFKSPTRRDLLRGLGLAALALPGLELFERSAVGQSVGKQSKYIVFLYTPDGAHPTVELPPGALKLIGQLLGAMSEGRPITLMPSKQEFSTVEAANFLDVSRPFVIKEIEAGRLPHRKVGTHRRVAFEDLVAYAREMRKRQEHALVRMADNARELGLDY